MSGILEFMAQFGDEKQCIEYLAELRWPDGLSLFKMWRLRGVAIEVSGPGFSMRSLRSSGIGDVRDDLPPNADGVAEMVSRRLSHGT